MPPRQPNNSIHYLKNPEVSLSIFSKRLRFTVIVILIAFIVLAVRYFYLQIIAHQKYTVLSQNNQMSIVPISPPRGLIFDRHGVLLAENVAVFNLELIPERIANTDKTIEALRSIIPIDNEQIQLFNREKARQRRFESVPLKVNLTEEEVGRFAIHQHRFPGVVVRARLNRAYPYKELLAHALGFIGRISEADLGRIPADEYQGTLHIGKSGIEETYETLLHGKVGFQQIENDSSGHLIRTLHREPPVRGQDLYLTLDLELQKIASAAVGDKKGALVAINPNNGEILAFVSKPSFDPNPFTAGIPAKDYSLLRNAPAKPLLNRVTSGFYPPASTIKPLVALAGLYYDALSPHDTISDPGFYQLPSNGFVYRDWKKGGHGAVNLEKAIVESCDTYFYRAASKIGIERLSDFLQQFGYGSQTGIDLSNEKAGTLPSPKWKKHRFHQPWFPGETLISGIGQGYFQVTPLQLSKAVSMLANHGLSITPHLLLQSKDESDTLIPFQFPEPETQMFDIHEEDWDRVTTAMNKVVHAPNGTAARIAHLFPDVQIAGKTGTAQVFSLKRHETYHEHNIDAELRDHTLFIGFAPKENPEIAIAVVVENSKGGKDTAGLVLRGYFDLKAKRMQLPHPSEILGTTVLG